MQMKGLKYISNWNVVFKSIQKNSVTDRARHVVFEMVLELDAAMLF